MKFYLEKKGSGKGTYFLAKEVKGKRLKEKENSGEELFGSKQDALRTALFKKKVMTKE